MYFENVDGYEGQGAFIQKFGLMIEQSATLTVARRRWDQMVGRFGQTTIPTRPNEGDLIYFPLTNAMFEIKFVQHQDPFYQLGKLYVYKLQVELFQYSSEHISTGIKEIDKFEPLKSYDVSVETITDGPMSYGDNEKFQQAALDVVFDTNNPFGDISTTAYTMDSNVLRADSSTVTMDRA